MQSLRDMRTESVANARGVGVQVTYDEIPDTCPICHHGIMPHIRCNSYAGHQREGALHTFFQCTRSECQSGFVGVYEAHPIRSAPEFHRLVKVWQRVAQEHQFGDPISGISPVFVDVYNQALAAEAHGLDQVAGLGIWKALEFLVKDFAISRDPSKADEIRKAFLANVIRSHIDDRNVQACATRAVWLGNDEAHYTRRWDDRDISDLKLLTSLTVNWIENVLLTERYIAEISG